MTSLFILNVYYTTHFGRQNSVHYLRDLIGLMDLRLFIL